MGWSLVNVWALFALIAIYTPFKPSIATYPPLYKNFLGPPTAMGSSRLTSILCLEPAIPPSPQPNKNMFAIVNLLL